MEWQPIETAPKDGSRLLLVWKSGKKVSILWWNGRGYPSFTTGSHDNFGTPDQYSPEWFTHWMPLPAPPTLDPIQS